MRPLLATAVTLLLTASAAAQPAMPRFSYKSPGGDGRFELVMLGTGELPEKWAALVGSSDAALRATYKRSGLYPVGNTTDPLWTTDEYWDYPTLPLPDGVHVVRIHRVCEVHFPSLQRDGFATGGRLPADAERADLDSPAVTFYARGLPIKTYTVRELVSDPGALPHGPDRVLWCDGSMFYPESGRYTVDTTDGNRIVFDPTTGEVIGRSKTGRWLARQAWTAAVVLAGVAAVGLAGVVGWRVWRRRMVQPAAAGTEPRGTDA